MGSEAARQVGAGSSYRMVGQEKSQTVGKYRVWCWWWPKGVLLPHVEIWLPDPTKTAPNSRTALSSQLSPVRSHHCCFCGKPHRFQSTFTSSLSFTPKDSSARWPGQGLTAVAQPPRVRTGKRGPERGVDLPKVTQPACGQAGAMLPNPYPAPSTVPCPPPHPVWCWPGGQGRTG